MSPLGGLLLTGLCLLFCAEYIRGVYFIQREYRDFIQCPGNTACPANAICEKSQWGKFCICNDGFCNRDHNIKLTCPSGTCDAGSCSQSPNNLTNSDINLSCRCRPGYTGVSGKCEDIDECSVYSSPCTSSGICINTPGDFSCTCPEGYDFNQEKDKSMSLCKDIDECSLSNSPCTPPAICKNVPGNFSCSCPSGYEIHKEKDNNMTLCKDIDECSVYSSPCTSSGICINTPGDFSCTCPEGYDFNQEKDKNMSLCKDIDECSLSNSPCTPPAICKNVPGNFSCSCPSGYEIHKEKDSNMTLCKGVCAIQCMMGIDGDLGFAECPVIEALQQHRLSKESQLRSLSKLVQCYDVTDIDECSVYSSPCTSSGICINNQGDFSCTCPEGYDFNQEKDKNMSLCKDIDECSLSNSPCTPPAICINVPGNFFCTCPSGYEIYTEKDNNRTLCKGKEIKSIDPEFNCESALSQEIKRLEECRKDRQNDLCAILERNIHIQRTACEGNETLHSVENVTKEIFQLLDQSLTNYNTSDQRTIVNFLLESVETAILTIFTKEPSNLRINTSELEAVMKVARESCDSNSSFLTLNLRRNSMSVPCGLVPGDNDGAFFVTYTDLQTSLNQVILSDSVSPQWLPSSVINSQVVTGSITVQEKENLDPPVSFYLKHLQAVDHSKTTLCVYWDPASQAWSRRGCVTQFSNGTHTLCSCSHVSSFAILTSLKDFQEDGGLTLLSRIGLSISIFCLAVSFLTFLLCRSIRSAHTSVLMALIGCLFLGQLLFLLGAHQTRNKLLCSIIAGGLHFFFLCAFCWMFLESVLLFLTVRNLRAMNYLTAKRHHFPYVCLIGFGVPVIIVTISAVIYPHEYGTERYCWLGPIVIWSFLGPVLVLIVINTTLLIATLCLLQVKLASLNTNVSTLKDKRLLIFKALAQIFILGCTWIFGFLQFGPGARVMSYVFTGLNSLQGAFILLVHCLLNQQVRNEYRKIFHRIHTKRSSLDATSKNTIPLSARSTNAYELSHE